MACQTGLDPGGTYYGMQSRALQGPRAPPGPPRAPPRAPQGPPGPPWVPLGPQGPVRPGRKSGPSGSPARAEVRIYGPEVGLGSESASKMIEKVEMRNEKMYVFHI